MAGERTHVFAVTLGPAAAQVRSPLDLVAAQRRLHTAGFGPLYRLDEVDADSEDVSARSAVTTMLVHVDGMPPQVTVTDATVFGGPPAERVSERVLVRCPPRFLDRGAALFPIVTVMLERRLQLAGFMSLQGACVGWSRGAVLILGPPGCGKTVTILALCRSHGARLVGNDLLVAGIAHQQDNPAAGTAVPARRERPTVVAGSTTVYVRPSALARHHPDLLEQTGLRAGTNVWTKVPLRPPTLGVDTLSGAVELIGAYLVHIDDRLPAPYVADAPPGIRYLLYENASRYLRATAEPFLGNAGQRFLAYLPGMDSPACHNARVNFVDRVINGLGIRCISGTAADVAAVIAAEVADP